MLPTEPLAEPLGSVRVDGVLGRAQLPELAVVCPAEHGRFRLPPTTTSGSSSPYCAAVMSLTLRNIPQTLARLGRVPI